MSIREGQPAGAAGALARPVSDGAASGEEGFTRLVAARACSVRYESLPSDIRSLSKQCVLDTIGVALAGAGEPHCRILRDEAREQGGAAVASVLGTGDRTSTYWAALLNGTAAHALDFDDVHMAIPGHASAAIVPALWALAEERHSSGHDVIAAFVAAFETACRVGLLVAPGHYDAGFHATGTIGAIACAAGCARLLELDTPTTAHAMGIAATQTAGLKAMLGTMCKPLHAGGAASNGLLAARLAARGFTSRLDALECAQGFAETHSVDFNPTSALVDPPAEFHLRHNIFKYHAACMLTHAVIEATRELRERHDLHARDVQAITARVERLAERVCTYDTPTSGMEAKFSVPFATALALLGRDSGRPDAYSDAAVTDPDITVLLDRVRVEFKDELPAMTAEVELRLTDGRVLRQTWDAGQPARDVEAERLARKFLTLAGPILGEQRAEQLRGAIEDLEGIRDVATIRGLLSAD